MAINRWLGAASPVAYSALLTVDAAELTGGSDQSITIHCGNAQVEVLLGTITTAAAAMTALIAAMNTSTVPLELQEATYTASGVEAMLITGPSGIEFSVSITEDVGAATGPVATLTGVDAATGPNFWSNVDNWSLGAIPIATNDVIVDGALPGILYGLSPSLVTLATFTVTSTFTGNTSNIGLPEINTEGYVEYRNRRLTINTSKLIINSGNGRGSSRLNLNVGTVACETIIYKTPLGAVEPPINLITNSASSDITLMSGWLQLGDRAGSEVNTTRNVYTSSTSVLAVGPNATITQLDNSGQTSCDGNITTLIHHQGTTTLNDASVTTLLDIRGGEFSKVNYNSNNTLAEVRLGGVLNLSDDIRPRTITLLNLRSEGILRDPYRSATCTTITIDASVKSISTKS